MTSEAVKVITRCRPLNQREKELKCQVIVNIDSTSGQCSLINPNDKTGPPKVFCFDGAYYVDSTTEQIYNEIVFPIVESVTEGYNSTVFAYGQTGCGKSFTMQGTSDSIHRGIIPRSFEHIFEAISTAENAKFLVQASYLEIYNEEIRDLLGADVKKKLSLKESSESGVYVSNLSMHIVNDVHTCETIMEEGWKNRSVGSTLMNADSSRSHSIFTIYVERIQIDDLENVKFGKLNLVDLAGSERQGKTGAVGERLKEATKINLSLSALGNVISALVDGKSKHIPYRDSKLTRLLQDSLGGNTKTLMVACISPADNNYDETLSTLRYANRAKNIQNKPKINEDPKETMLREYQEEIMRLKNLLQEHSSSHGEHEKPNMDKGAIEKIKQDYDDKFKDLLLKYEEEVRNKEKLKEDISKLKSIYENDTEKSKSDSRENSVIRVMEKLKAIEGQMVGGEKANDAELKEKRARKKKIAETKLNAISEALSQLNDDDKILLKAYGDITEELRAKSLLLKKAKRKIQSLEQEVSDLQSEFEIDRMDYLETIRKQEEQFKLLTQILYKIEPFLHNNNIDIDQIKSNSIWDENNEQWILPNITISSVTKLPPAYFNDKRVEDREISPSHYYKPESPTSVFDSDIIDLQAHDMNGYEDRLLRRMENSKNNDIVTKYFMPKRREQLLNNLHKLKLNVPLIEDGNSSDINCFDSHQNATQLMNSISNRITERSNRFNAQVDHISHKFGHLSLNGNSQSQPMLGSSQSAETPRKLLPLKRV